MFLVGVIESLNDIYVAHTAGLYASAEHISIYLINGLRSGSACLLKVTPVRSIASRSVSPLVRMHPLIALRPTLRNLFSPSTSLESLVSYVV